MVCSHTFRTDVFFFTESSGHVLACRCCSVFFPVWNEKAVQLSKPWMCWCFFFVFFYVFFFCKPETIGWVLVGLKIAWPFTGSHDLWPISSRFVRWITLGLLAGPDHLRTGRTRSVGWLVGANESG